MKKVLCLIITFCMVMITMSVTGRQVSATNLSNGTYHFTRTTAKGKALCPSISVSKKKIVIKGEYTKGKSERKHKIKGKMTIKIASNAKYYLVDTQVNKSNYKVFKSTKTYGLMIKIKDGKAVALYRTN